MSLFEKAFLYAAAVLLLAGAAAGVYSNVRWPRLHAEKVALERQLQEQREQQLQIQQAFVRFVQSRQDSQLTADFNEAFRR